MWQAKMMLVRPTRRAVTTALATPQRWRRAAHASESLVLRAVTSVAVCSNVGHTAQRQWFCSSSSGGQEPSQQTAAVDVAERKVTPKNEKDALFLRALRRFHEHEGHFFVPTDFVVPKPSDDEDAEAVVAVWPKELWGLPLGQRLRNFARGISNEYKRAMLKSVGFPYDDWKTYVWEEQLLPSLRTFKEMEGHTFVRFPFVVPENDDRFPRCAWGFKLGFAVALLRQQRDTLPQPQVQTLNKMEFIWTENHFKLKVLFLPALKRFKEIFGHAEVPGKFVIGDDADEELWGSTLRDTKLGYLYGCLKTGFFDTDTVADCSDELETIGAFDTDGVERVWKSLVVPALDIYSHVHGHTDIPVDFIVPSEAPWPAQSWGYRLGYVVECILKEGVFADQVAASKAELRKLGYRWDVLFGRWSRQLLPALRCFYEAYGHSDVPATFVVPNDDPWPEEARKYNLGRQLQLLRKLGRDSSEVTDALDELDALGFKFNVLESDFNEKILPALHTYASKFGHCDVPRGFVVPNDDSWPEKAWGLKLGAAASAIRARKQYRKQVDENRDELKALGFSWPMPQTTTAVDREVVQPCIAIYKEIYGEDAMPDADFVVPANDKRWPVEASGFKLGRWLQTHSRRRRLPSEGGREGAAATSMAGAGVTKRGSRRSGVLEPHQEQYWNDVLMSSFKAYAEVHGSCREMDGNFVVPSEAPFPQIAWGLNLGLRVRYIRHHDRYAAEVDKYRDELEALGIIENK